MRFTFDVTFLIQEKSHEKEPVITGFSYEHISGPTFENLPLLPNVEPYKRIEQWLNSSTSLDDALTLADFESTPIGIMNAERNQSFVIFDNHLVARLSGESMDKVSLYESVFQLEDATKIQLSDRLMGIGLGDSVEHVRSQAKGDIFEFGDTIEISQSGYTYNVYIYNENGKDVVYQSELLLY